MTDDEIESLKHTFNRIGGQCKLYWINDFGDFQQVEDIGPEVFLSNGDKLAFVMIFLSDFALVTRLKAKS